jgi:hypothetical protein
MAKANQKYKVNFWNVEVSVLIEPLNPSVSGLMGKVKQAIRNPTRKRFL